MDVARLLGEAIAHIVEVLLHVAADLAHGLHHHRLGLRRDWQIRAARLAPGYGRRHDLLPHRSRKADGTLDQPSGGLVVVV